MNTKIEYLYRDAGNYKVHNECVIRGEISEEQIDMILRCLDSGECFIPEQVGLPAKRFDDINEDDHCFMELERGGFSLTYEDPTVPVDTDQLVSDFASARNNWDCGIPL